MPVSDAHLEPCPFCGGELVEAMTFTTRSGKCMVHPRTDMHCTGAGLRVWTNDPESIANWNRRALSLPQGAPVAWRAWADGDWSEITNSASQAESWRRDGRKVDPLYASPDPEGL